MASSRGLCSNRLAIAATFWKSAHISFLLIGVVYCCTDFFGTGVAPGPVSSFESIAFVRFQASPNQGTSRLHLLSPSFRVPTTTMATVLSCEPPSAINDAFGVADVKEGIPSHVAIEEFEVATDNTGYVVEKRGYLTTEDGSSSTRASTKAIKPEEVFTASSLRAPLRFNFTGYSIWLEVEEFDNDVSRTLDEIAHHNGILPIPSAHVTAIYGMTHLTEQELRQRFRTMTGMAKFCQRWPEELRPVGVLADVELAGVNGGLMDMAWAEVTLASSPAHEEHLDDLHDLFHAGHKDHSSRPGPWKPHLSLAYDNPEESVLNLGDVVDSVLRASLLKKGTRRVTGFSLWDTNGQLQDWKCMDRFMFD